MSSMLDWAKKEVELACKRENPEWDGKSFDYGCSCYQSALKAYESLLEDGHSGFSFAMTTYILERLMHCLPLTPIEDIPNNWKFSYVTDGPTQVYQNKRCPHLFKYKQGRKIWFEDVERYSAHYEDETISFTGGGISQIIEHLWPLKMPYFPRDTAKFVVTCRQPSKEDGDIFIINIKTPEGKAIEFNKTVEDILASDPNELLNPEIKPKKRRRTKE